MDNHNITHRQIDRYKDRYTLSKHTQIYNKIENNWHRTGTDISLVENNRYRTGTDFSLWKTTGTGPEFPFVPKFPPEFPFTGIPVTHCQRCVKIDCKHAKCLYRYRCLLHIVLPMQNYILTKSYSFSI